MKKHEPHYYCVYCNTEWDKEDLIDQHGECPICGDDLKSSAYSIYRTIEEQQVERELFYQMEQST